MTLPSLVEIGQMVLEKKILNVEICYYLAFDKDLTLFWRNVNPIIQWYFVPSLIESDQGVLEKKMKMLTVYR